MGNSETHKQRTLKILVVDDDPGIRKTLVDFLLLEGYEFELAANGSQAQLAIDNITFDLVLLDLFLPGLDGNELLREIKQKQPDCEVVIITGFASVPTASKSFSWGAHAYLRKPFKLNDLNTIIKDVIELIELRDLYNRHTRQQLEAEKIENLIAASSPMKDVVKSINKLKDVRNSVILTGEAHTGKRFVARIIHHTQSKPDSIYIHLKSDGISKFLETGEFDLKEDGVLRRDNFRESLESMKCSTLILESIATLSKDQQHDLLELLNDFTLDRTDSGSDDKPIRIIGIVETVSDYNEYSPFLDKSLGEFFTDHIHIPSLSERPEDILLLAYLFIKKAVEDFTNIRIRISQPVQEFLQMHHWRENLKEMKTLIMSIVEEVDDDTITIKDMRKVYSEIHKDHPHDLEEVLKQLVIAERKTLDRIFE